MCIYTQKQIKKNNAEQESTVLSPQTSSTSTVVGPSVQTRLNFSPEGLSLTVSKVNVDTYIPPMRGVHLGQYGGGGGVNHFEALDLFFIYYSDQTFFYWGGKHDLKVGSHILVVRFMSFSGWDK